MGFLDEAIREHLDLKRQHGADPGELARLEQEALGPPVRETHEVLASASAATATTVAPEGVAPDVEPAPEGIGEGAEMGLEPQPYVEPASGVVPEATVEAESGAEPDLAFEPVPPAPLADPLGQETVAFAADDIFADEPAPAQPPPDPGTSQPAAAPDPAAAPAGDQPDPAPGEAGPSDDVLEETPDFLQETPEHDRLWFEQKPPRDFDFDD